MNPPFLRTADSVPLAVASLHMAGKTAPKIAKDLNMPATEIRRALRTSPVKALIKEMKDRLIHGGLPQAVENVVAVITQYANPLETDELGRPTAGAIQRRDHGMKASLRLLEGTGLLPSAQAPVLVTNINNSLTIAPVINNMLDKELQSVLIDMPPQMPLEEEILS